MKMTPATYSDRCGRPRSRQAHRACQTVHHGEIGGDARYGLGPDARQYRGHGKVGLPAPRSIHPTGAMNQQTGGSQPRRKDAQKQMRGNRLRPSRRKVKSAPGTAAGDDC